MTASDPLGARSLLLAWRGSAGERRRAWDILRSTVCDRCGAATFGLGHELDAAARCGLRLRSLPEAVAGPFDPAALPPRSELRALGPAALRALGRVGVPLLARRGEDRFAPLSWQDAAALAGTLLRDARGRLALLVGAEGLGNEDLYQLQKWARLLGSPHVDRVGDPGSDALAAALAQVRGSGGSDRSVEDAAGADLLVLWAVGLDAQPGLRSLVRQARRRGAHVVSINPLREPRGVDRHVLVRPGGDRALARALLARSAGALSLSGTDGDAARAGLDVATVRDLLRRLRSAERPVLALGPALGRGPSGVGAASAVAALAAHLDLGVLLLGAAAGRAGAWECGLGPGVLPGGRAASPDALASLQRAWGGLALPEGPGLQARQVPAAVDELDAILSAGGGLDRLLWRHPASPGLLRRVPLHLHLDLFLRPSMLLESAEAVLVLPTRSLHEHRGGVTITSTDGAVRFSPQVLGHPPSQSVEPWRVPEIVMAAVAPGLADLLTATSAVALRSEMASLIPRFDGLDALERPGQELRANVPPAPAEPAELIDGEVDEDGPSLAGTASMRAAPTPEDLLLCTRRHLPPGQPRDRLCFSPATAAALGLGAGQRARLRSDSGRLDGVVVLRAMAEGTVQACWPEAVVLLGDEAAQGGARRVRVEALSPPTSGAG